MPRRIKVPTVLVLALAALFFLFFDRSKHVPALAAVNPFNVDPYDAVGSFAIQLAAFAALLSLIRAFRSYPSQETASNQALLVLRGETVTLLSIAITWTADSIAIFRDPAPASGSPAGLTLMGLLIGLAVLTVLAGWWLYQRAKDMAWPSGNHPWVRAFAICLESVVILAIYPSSWDEGIVGGIATALLGMVILFILVWALTLAIFPPTDMHFDDLIDDLVSIYHWFKSHAGFAIGLFEFLEKLVNLRWVRALLGWLNPRRHAWNFIILIAIAAGLFLALAEAIGEGASPNPGRFVLISSVFIVIEGAGVLAGYGLLARFLGLYRPE